MIILIWNILWSTNGYPLKQEREGCFFSLSHFRHVGRLMETIKVQTNLSAKYAIRINPFLKIKKWVFSFSKIPNVF